MAETAETLTSPFGWDLINDVSALPENEDIIIDYLLERLQHGKIYTWVGPLLLVLNPYNEVRTCNIYDSLELEKYMNTTGATRDELDPHIYAVASRAHYRFTHKLGEDEQVIVISGETGTGKTFNACKCLEFLSAVNNNVSIVGQGDYACNIMQRLTDACRLISAFSTACTERNEVSSRHGQLVRLHYRAGAITGAMINSLLLERSRVTRGSNNFQIFYQMMFGMSDEELGSFNLSRTGSYCVLGSIDPGKRKHFEEGFQDTLKAIEVLGFDEAEKRHIFQSLALLIHMGNIQFIKNEETCTIDLDDARSREALENTCCLTGLNQEGVIELVTTILISPQSVWRMYTSYHRNLITIDACRNRLYSIIRHVYDLLFHWILNHANNALSTVHPCPKWLGILDIFGFESFDVNGIEQLCVNYANEKMQKHFIETYLENGRKDLQEEGFISTKKSWDTIYLYQNRLCVLEEALFLTLNDASQSAVTVEMSTIIQLACGNVHNKRYRILNEKEGNFIIEHYSGPVAYSIKDILSKNSDKVPAELSTTFNASKNHFLRFLINTNERDEAGAERKTCTRKRTMLAKLKYSMDMLIKELSRCNLYYVRCIKPSRSSNRKWDRKDLQRQLANTGIFDALPLARCKYPIRMSYEDFYKRYRKKCIAGVSVTNEACKTILESVASYEELGTTVHYGKRLLFLTESIFFTLERFRRNYRNRCARRIQSFWLKHRQRRSISISKYGNSSLEESENFDQNKNIKNILERESKILSGSEEDDEVFIMSDQMEDIPLTISQRRESKHGQSYMLNVSNSNQSNLLITEEVKDEVQSTNSASEKSSEDCAVQQCDITLADSKNLQANDRISLQKRATVTAENINVTNCLRDIVNYSTRRTFDEQFLNGTCENSDCKVNVDINFNYFQADKCSETGLNNFLDNKRKKYVVQYHKERGLYSIELEAYTLFYKNRILSRRRLAAVPIKVHTRSTCLPYSHMPPRSELPQGLQDCL